MEILILTKEQSIEIAETIYPYDKSDISNIVVMDQEYDGTMYEDAKESIIIEFNADYNGTIRNWRIEISINLDCSFYMLTEYDGSDTYMPHWKSLHTFNQYETQKKFRDWGIYPNKAEEREEEIKKLLENE